MRRWMVYYKDAAGEREGQAIIYAESREQAIEEYRRYYGRYLCREWNRDNTNGEYLETFDIYFIIERTTHPEEDPTILSPWKLWNHKCY